MKRLLREYRLIPIVLIATVSLLVLKSLGLVFDGGYTLAQRLGKGETMTVTTVTTVPASPSTPLQSPSKPLDLTGAGAGPKPWMKDMFNFPEPAGHVASRSGGRDATIITGSVAASKPKAPEPPVGQVPAAETRAAAATPAAGGGLPDQVRPGSAAERSILERLQQRRQELEARARELDIRESLLKATEGKIEARIAELHAAEARLVAGQQKKEEGDAARFKSIVTMYEGMKPKEAAKIFDRLDMRVLLDVTSQIKPQKMSEIMAQMSPESAEKLTVELANRAQNNERTPNPSDLPKIEGRPTGG